MSCYIVWFRRSAPPRVIVPTPYSDNEGGLQSVDCFKVRMVTTSDVPQPSTADVPPPPPVTNNEAAILEDVPDNESEATSNIPDLMEESDEEEEDADDAPGLIDDFDDEWEEEESVTDSIDYVVGEEDELIALPTSTHPESYLFVGNRVAHHNTSSMPFTDDFDQWFRIYVRGGLSKEFRRALKELLLENEWDTTDGLAVFEVDDFLAAVDSAQGDAWKYPGRTAAVFLKALLTSGVNRSYEVYRAFMRLDYEKGTNRTFEGMHRTAVDDERRRLNALNALHGDHSATTARELDPPFSGDIYISQLDFGKSSFIQFDPVELEGYNIPERVFGISGNDYTFETSDPKCAFRTWAPSIANSRVPSRLWNHYSVLRTYFDPISIYKGYLITVNGGVEWYEDRMARAVSVRLAKALIFEALAGTDLAGEREIGPNPYFDHTNVEAANFRLNFARYFDEFTRMKGPNPTVWMTLTGSSFDRARFIRYFMSPLMFHRLRNYTDDGIIHARAVASVPLEAYCDRGDGYLCTAIRQAFREGDQPSVNPAPPRTAAVRRMRVLMVKADLPREDISVQEFQEKFPAEEMHVYPGDKVSPRELKALQRERDLIVSQCKMSASDIFFVLDSAVVGPYHYCAPGIKQALKCEEDDGRQVECTMANGISTRKIAVTYAEFLGSCGLDDAASANLLGWHKLAHEHGLCNEGDDYVQRIYRKSDRRYLFTAHYVPCHGFLLTHLDLKVASAIMKDDDKNLVRAVGSKKQSAIEAAAGHAAGTRQRRAASVPTASIVQAPPRQPVTSQEQGDLVNAPLTADELHRAEKARDLHVNNGHPSDQVLGKALDSNAIAGCDLTSRDVVNAKRAFGDCEACTVAKMTDPASARASAPPSGIGSRVYVDISPFPAPTLGNNNFYHFAMEAITGYFIFVAVASKSAADTWSAAWAIVSHINQFRFVVSEFCTDSESTYLTLKEPLAGKGIEYMAYPPYSHCVPIERGKRTIEERRAAIRAGLSFLVPPGLEGELVEYTMTVLNHMPNSKTGNSTSIQLMSGRRAVGFGVSWGQCVFVYDNRAGVRIAEKGIVVNVRVTVLGVSLKIFLPMRNIAVVRSRNVDLAGPYPDPAWNFVPNSIPRSPRQRLHNGPPVFPPVDADDADPTPTYDTIPTDLPTDADDEGDWTVGYGMPAQQDIQSYAPAAVPAPGFQAPAPSTARVYYDAAPDVPSGSPAHQASPSPAANAAPRTPVTTPQKQSAIARVPVQRESVERTAATPVKAREPAHTPQATIAREFAAETVAHPQAHTPPRPPVAVPSAPVVSSQVPPPGEELRRSLRARPATDYAKLHKTGFGFLGHVWINAVIVYRIVVNHVTLRAALAGPYRAPSEVAILKELKNILEVHDSIEAIAWQDLTSEQRGRARRKFMFIVLKYLADGSFDKVKARWVYGAANAGTILDEEPRDTNAPTVNPITTLVLLFMIAAHDMEMEVHDVPGAFLKSEMAPDAQPLYGFVGPELTGFIREHYPALASKISPKGSLFFRLKRYIYGTNEASKRFYDTMSSYFLSLGFRQSKSDPCLFIKTEGTNTIFVGVYVDDLLVTASSKDQMAWISGQLRSRWDTVHHTGDEFNYVGLHLVRDRAHRAIRIDMSGNVKKLIAEFGKDVKPCSSPAVEGILEQSGTPLDAQARRGICRLLCLCSTPRVWSIWLYCSRRPSWPLACRTLQTTT